MESKDKYAAQKKYQAKVGWVSKSYKLKKEVIDAFAEACEGRGRRESLGAFLEERCLSFSFAKCPEVGRKSLFDIWERIRLNFAERHCSDTMLALLFCVNVYSAAQA